MHRNLFTEGNKGNEEKNGRCAHTRLSRVSHLDTSELDRKIATMRMANFQRARPSKAWRVLGIMSGTSLDAVDYALCSIRDDHVRLDRSWQAKFPRAIRRRLTDAARGLATSHELAQLHHDLGRVYAHQAKSGLNGTAPDLAGLHGQTIFHNPAQPAATLQLGEPAYVVEMLRVPVVSNFRAADLAAGGQGAPLATLFHRLVFGSRGGHVCVHNLGGISNVTSIDWTQGRSPTLLAFDTGPANVLIDLAVQYFSRGKKHFDAGGEWARRGAISEELLQCWLKHPYFRKPPPKSTGRELFGEAFLVPALESARTARLSRLALTATLTELTARSIALNYRLHLSSTPSRVVLTGGGGANSHLVQRIRFQLQELNSEIDVRTSESYGWPLQSIEPAAFALLAAYRVQGKPGNIPSTTGAAHSALLGQLSEP